jgi:hypothetical protein
MLELFTSVLCEECEKPTIRVFPNGVELKEFVYSYSVLRLDLDGEEDKL